MRVPSAVEGSAPLIRVRGLFRSCSVRDEGRMRSKRLGLLPLQLPIWEDGERHDAPPGRWPDPNPCNGWYRLSIAVSLKSFGRQNTAGTPRIDDIVGLAELSAYDDGDWRRWDAGSYGAVVSRRPRENDASRKFTGLPAQMA